MEELRKQPPSPSPAKAGFGGQSPPEGRGGGPPPNLPTSTPPQPPQPPQPFDTTQGKPPQGPPFTRQQPPPYTPEQKRPYLERGEVRSMEKDMVRIREDEARQEQQRIAQLKAQRERESEQEAIAKIRATAFQVKQREEAQRQEQLKKIQSSILPPGEERRVRDLPNPPSPGKKVFVRLLVLFFAFIALNVMLFAAWLLFFRDQATSFQFPEIPFVSQFFSQQEPSPPPPSQPPAPVPQPAPTPTPTPPAPSPQPQPMSSPDVLRNAVNPAYTATLQFTDQSDLSSLLAQFLRAPQRPGFTQLLFRQKSDNALVQNGDAFFTLFGANVPESARPHFTGNALFFSYAYERGNRFGMIVETPSPQEASVALAAWESQMEQTITPLMPFWGTHGTGYTTGWRSSAHQGVEIRFQTFSLSDYGIVHAVVDNYVIFASSFEATKAAIEALQTISLNTPFNNTLASLPDFLLFKPPSTLSDEQALGQVFMLGFEGISLTPELEDFMKRLQPGGVLLLSKNIQSVEQLRQLTQDLQRVSSQYSSLPLFIAVDQEGGAISRIEFGREKTAQSAIVDKEHAWRVGQERAEELKFLGVNLNLSPVLDSTNANDFLFDRTFQAGRLEAGKLAQSLLAGQKEAGILSTLKHFPGYGNISFNPEQKLAAVQEFPDISPFVFALPANPEFLLLSNVVYSSLDPNKPFPFSPKGVSLVRNDLGFEGIILTDDLSQSSLLSNYSLEDMVGDPLRAGVTMLMFSKQDYAQEAHETLSELASQDPLLKKAVEDSAARILQLKKQFFFEAEPATPFEHLSSR